MSQFRTPDGSLVEADNPVAEAYYLREPGFELAAGDIAPEIVDATVVDGLVRPADSDLKSEWVDYAKALAPDDAEWIEDASTTKQELIDKYGG